MKKLFILIYTLIVFSDIFGSSNESPILIISIPKCGTHLIGKLIHLLTGKVHITPGFQGDSKNLGLFRSKIFAFNNENKFSHLHAPFSEENLKFLENNNIKTIFIYRDPRDQIISAINYCKFFIHLHDSINWNLDIMHAIKIKRGGINFLYNSMLPWKNQNMIYAIRYEDLVGVDGGGSSLIQINTIVKLAQFLGINYDSDFINSLISKMYGGTATFHKGKIGKWKDYFTDAHKMEFKKEAGQLLIDLDYENDCNW